MLDLLAELQEKTLSIADRNLARQKIVRQALESYKPPDEKRMNSIAFEFLANEISKAIVKDLNEFGRVRFELALKEIQRPSWSEDLKTSKWVGGISELGALEQLDTRSTRLLIHPKIKRHPLGLIVLLHEVRHMKQYFNHTISLHGYKALEKAQWNFVLKTETDAFGAEYDLLNNLKPVWDLFESGISVLLPRPYPPELRNYVEKLGGKVLADGQIRYLKKNELGLSSYTKLIDSAVEDNLDRMFWHDHFEFAINSTRDDYIKKRIDEGDYLQENRQTNLEMLTNLGIKTGEILGIGSGVYFGAYILEEILD